MKDWKISITKVADVGDKYLFVGTLTEFVPAVPVANVGQHTSESDFAVVIDVTKNAGNLTPKIRDAATPYATTEQVAAIAECMQHLAVMHVASFANLHDKNYVRVMPKAVAGMAIGDMRALIKRFDEREQKQQEVDSPSYRTDSQPVQLDEDGAVPF